MRTIMILVFLVFACTAPIAAETGTSGGGTDPGPTCDGPYPDKHCGPRPPHVAHQ